VNDAAAGAPAATPAGAAGGTVGRSGGSGLVAAGILASRLAGLVRDVVTAQVFGLGAHLDVFRTALRAPNILQNLLGEGTLSAAFIPVYSRMLAEGRREEAGRFAGAVFGLLLVAVAVLVGAGVLLAEPLVALLVPGILEDRALVAAGLASVDRYPLAVAAVRWVFPMTGLLVLSAWALGVLNSHRRFLLPYLAPVLWNAAIIAALLYAGGWNGPWSSGAAAGGEVAAGAPAAGPLPQETMAAASERAALDRLLFAACAGALLGGALQLLVQLPLVAREMRGFRLAISRRVTGVREALAAFVPVVTGRGVAQLGAYLDTFLASFLAAGALGGLAQAQTLYLLPISLFGLSVAAAELPELAAAAREDTAAVVARAQAGLARMAFFTVPTVVVYLGFGLPLVSALFERGRFDRQASFLIAAVLAAYALGILPTVSSRLLQNVCYARGEAAAAARVGMARTLLAAGLGTVAMLGLDRVPVSWLPGAPEAAAGGAVGALHLGAAGLALGSGVAAWIEAVWLARVVRRVLPSFGYPFAAVRRLFALAAAAAVAGAAVWWLLAGWAGLPRLLESLVVLAAVAVTYLGGALWLRVPERTVLARLPGFARWM
jgi:putative peptidoglycan lipid II flippase